MSTGHEIKTNPARLFLDENLLEKHLSHLLCDENNFVAKVKILSRTRYITKATFPSEIATCTVNGKIIKLLCKYTCRKINRQSAVEYEATVYRDIVNLLPFSHAPYFGSYNFFLDDLNCTCLVLEYMEGSEQINQKEPLFFAKAAEWIAHFHTHLEGKIFPNVKVLNAPYYLRVADYTSALVEELDSDLKWMLGICDYFRANIHVLLEAPQTVVHGEFYGKNILVKNNTIYPVDWETAAIGIGEIDLWGLMDGKDEERSQLALESYKKTRWVDCDVPRQFERRLLLAGLYNQFRWIEDWRLKPEDLTRWMSSSSYSRKLLKLAEEAEVC